MPPAPSSSAIAEAPVNFVVPYGAANASVRVRVLDWLERLAPEQRARASISGPDHERRMPAPGGTTVLLRNRARISRGRREQGLLQRAGLGVYELDDGLPWDDGNLPDLGRWWKRPFPRSLVAERAAAAADRMIVGNAVLADWAAEHCDDVRLIPTCVDPGRYARRDPTVQGDELAIGWIGSPATQHFLDDIAGALRAVAAERPVRVEVIGAVEARIPSALAGLVEIVPWESGIEYQRLASWSVGVMPLRDGLYERAKCGYKLLQYAAAGIPAIGSPVGVNADILASMAASAPTSEDEWVDALRAVADAGPSQRVAWSEGAARTAAAYSFDVWQERWMAATGFGSEVASCASST